MYSLMLYNGLRVDEVRNLVWADVDFEANNPSPSIHMLYKAMKILQLKLCRYHRQRLRLRKL